MIVFNKGFDHFLHSLMPARLQDSLNPYGGIYIRARALSAILVSISIIGIVICLMVGALHFWMDSDVFTYEGVLLAITGVILLQTWLYYTFSNYAASSLGFTIFYFLVSTVMLILSGGYDSPGKIFLITSPMIAFLVSGWQEGLQNAALTILFGLAMVVLKAIDFDLPNIFYGEIQQVMFMVNWLITVMVMLSCFIIYEVGIAHSHNRPDEYVNDARARLMKFDSKLEKFLHSLVPVALREHLDIHSRLYARVRILSVMLYGATFLSAIAMILFFPVHLFLEPERLKSDAFVAGVTALLGLQAWVFYKYHNHRVSGFIFGYFSFLLIIFLVIISGGYDSPAITLLMAVPVAFFVAGGIREGVQNSIWVGIAGVVLGFLKHKGFDLDNVFSDASETASFAIMWGISISGIALCLLAYDMELEKRA